MQAKEIVKLVEKLAVPILEKKGLEFVDVEYVKEGASWYLRLYIDKEGGVGIDECVDVSRELDAQLDDDMTEQAYILEVSSPGLGRPLKKGEVVHHKDGNPRNNLIDNLEVLGSQVEHAKLHCKNGRFS